MWNRDALLLRMNAHLRFSIISLYRRNVMDDSIIPNHARHWLVSTAWKFGFYWMIDGAKHIQLCTTFFARRIVHGVIRTTRSLVHGIFHATVEKNLTFLLNAIQWVSTGSYRFFLVTFLVRSNSRWSLLRIISMWNKLFTGPEKMDCACTYEDQIPMKGALAVESVKVGEIYLRKV